jgi:hypothetical protein
LPVWRSGYAVDCRSTTTRFESGHWLFGEVYQNLDDEKKYEAFLRTPKMCIRALREKKRRGKRVSEEGR